MSSRTAGLYAGLASYIFWGLSPVYWKLLDQASGLEVLAHRLVWSFFFLLAVILVQGRGGEVINAFRDKKTAVLLFFSSVAISINWGVFIISVNTGHILQASLGYYMNPFVSMVFGILIFKERLSRLQIFAVILAAAGVLIYASGLKGFPWASISLAISFAAYGALRKHVRVLPVPGLLAETVIMLPFALGYLAYVEYSGSGNFGHYSYTYDFLFILSGLVTSAPLLGFAFAVKRLKLITVGILQFTVPTLHFLLGVFTYSEPFTPVHAATFGLIWLCVGLFISDAVKNAKKS
ncbi:EamA family transporter RarD [Geovibrio thiophilus]|uniref:EamA family transporter RarD n=1 Tax=Geovibrio thiophilus TaxID=139438 RepID=A0A3R5Z0C1_9BACT|nr:EamA family transporter RarD [Geovibrio thiophilus]QAR33919.1 EamA family transporter RarD [Geovibrio thiophilus]